MSNAETVQAIYEAFGRGDVHTILLIKFEATAGGKKYSFPNNGHLWQFDGAGKVVKYDHVADTAQS